MIRRDGNCTTPSGTTLFYQQWKPADRPARAALAIVHGFGEHSELYHHLAEYFVPRGYAVFAVDLRGHGRSSGARGHIRTWADYREDVDGLVENVRREAPALPVFLVGHSMGGLIAIEYALHQPARLAGLVAMGPSLGDIGISRFLVFLSRALSRIWPTFSLDTGLESAAMSRDAQAVARLEADPLVHSRASARLGTEVLDTIARVRRDAGELKIPILIQHGEADRVALPGGSLAFFESIVYPDKELKTYPGGYHNLFVDLNWEEVMGDIDEWVGRHL